MSLLTGNFTKVREVKQAHEKRRGNPVPYMSVRYTLFPLKLGGFQFANETNVEKKATGEANSMT